MQYWDSGSLFEETVDSCYERYWPGEGLVTMGFPEECLVYQCVANWCILAPTESDKAATDVLSGDGLFSSGCYDILAACYFFVGFPSDF